MLAPVMGFIDAMLREDLSAPRKQRHTVARIRQRLRAEHGFNTGSYSTVAAYVARRRAEITAEARQRHRHLEGMVPQQHKPGAEAEVDFADVWIRLAGTPVKCHLFTFRLSYSAKAVHRVYATEAQEAFMEGHVEAFRALGGVPTRHIRYDNLKPAVHRVCFGRTRIESQRWVAFRSHYGFDAFYCLPGAEGAHEKGGVEQEGGRFRRTHLVPVPDFDTLAELNETLAAIDKAEDARRVHGSPVSIGAAFTVEAPLLAPLPEDEFDCGLPLTPTVRRDSRIVVRQCYYSVPARFIGAQVRVSLRANELLIYDGRKVIARHRRLTRRYDYHDELDSTAPARSCCSRSSPTGRNAAPSRSPPTHHSPNGNRPSPTPGSATPSSTDSPSTPPSSKPAPTPTDSAPPPATSAEPGTTSTTPAATRHRPGPAQAPGRAASLCREARQHRPGADPC